MFMEALQNWLGAAFSADPPIFTYFSPSLVCEKRKALIFFNEGLLWEWCPNLCTCVFIHAKHWSLDHEKGSHLQGPTPALSLGFMCLQPKKGLNSLPFLYPTFSQDGQAQRVHVINLEAGSCSFKFLFGDARQEGPCCRTCNIMRPRPAVDEKGLVLWHQFGLVDRGRNKINDWPRGKKLSAWDWRLRISMVRVSSAPCTSTIFHRSFVEFARPAWPATERSMTTSFVHRMLGLFELCHLLETEVLVLSGMGIACITREPK